MLVLITNLPADSLENTTHGRFSYVSHVPSTVFVASSVSVGVGALTVSLVVLPLADVDVSIGMYESALAVGSVLAPGAFVAAAVAPDLVAPAMSRAVSGVPFSVVCREVIQILNRLSRYGDSGFRGLLGGTLEFPKSQPDVLNPLSLFLKFDRV